MCLYQVMMTLHISNDKKIENYVASIKSETMGKLSLPGSALRTHVESLGKPRDVIMRSQSLAW